jgi:hypothetical protein
MTTALSKGAKPIKMLFNITFSFMDEFSKCQNSKERRRAH